ncbi:MAG: hypothetical protein J7M34_02245 [Anaerolineae bacterium]|nr:hypothetical protein [Anaerolineae bacterium]
MQFNLRVVPFSRYGSYQVFSHLIPPQVEWEGLYLRNIRGPGTSSSPWQQLFRVTLLRDHTPIPFQEIASPTHLRLEADNGQATIIIYPPNTVRFRCTSTGLRLEMDPSAYDTIIPLAQNNWQIISTAVVETKYRLIANQGHIRVQAPWRRIRSEQMIIDLLPDPTTHIGEFSLIEFTTAWPDQTDLQPFDLAMREVEEEYQKWLQGIPSVPDRYAQMRERAAYVLWSCTVSPSGHLRRPAIYMSKNRMASIWSWDNSFIAIALSAGHPQLAWDQFMIPFDHQDASGMIPDLINDRLISWSFCKPPIHGWALQHMMQNTTWIGRDQLKEIYLPLARWTEWWFTHRDDDHDGIPSYHHGNESGWDNSTVFAESPPIESPDLAAYLVLQMEVLARIAHVLGNHHEANSWQGRAQELLHKLLDHFWSRDRFIARRSGTHEPISPPSLQLLLPLILGKRLPQAIYNRCVAQVREFITPHGLATEHPSSPFYEPDGYWRGPIWGAPIALLVDGLDAGGDHELAYELRRRFVETVAQSGLAENYDAFSGRALRDPAFTWTAAIALSLAHDLVDEAPTQS